MRSKKAIRNIVASLLQQLISIISMLIIPVFIINNYGSGVYGLTMSITQFLAYISLLEAGFGPVVKSILYKPIAKKDKNEITNILKSSEKFFRKISYIFLAYIVALCFVYPFFVIEEYDFIFTLSLIIIISISTFFEYFLGITYRLFLQADQKTYFSSYIQILSYILNTIVTIILVKINVSIQVLKLFSSLIFIIRPIAQNIYVKKVYKINLKEANEKVDIKQKWNALAQHIAYVINSNADIAILTLFSSMANVAVYSVYNLIMTGIKNIVNSLSGGIDASFGDMMAKNEKNQLNKSFGVYEFFYFTLVTIIYASTIILLLPFVKIYTRGVTDANYIVPVFAVLIAITTMLYSIRNPYSSIIYAAGHFKQTKNGAWIEAILNLLISCILIGKFGLVGIAIGTFISMFIRTTELIYYTNKNILERKQFISIYRVITSSVEILIIVYISRFIPNGDILSYVQWIKKAILVAILATSVVLPINVVTNFEEWKIFCSILKRNIMKKNIKEM